MTGPLASPRQVRRLVALALAVALAGLFRLGPSAQIVFIVAVAHVAALMLLQIAPARRRLVEAAAVGLVLPAALPVTLEVYLCLAVVCGGLAHALVYGRAGQRARLRFTAVATRVTRAGLPLDAVWVRLVPGSSHPDDYWSGTLVDFAADRDDPMTLYARFASDTGLFTEATFSFLTAEPPHEAHYQVELDTLPEDQEMSLHLRLTGEDRFSTLIESEAVRGNLTLAQAALLWFDDTMGDDWPGVAGPGTRWRTWQVERLPAPDRAPHREPAPAPAVDTAVDTVADSVADTVADSVAAAPAVSSAPVAAPVATRAGVAAAAAPDNRPRILNARLKDLPDPDDFEEPFDILRLIEEVRA